jgi:hypothetical protein
MPAARSSLLEELTHVEQKVGLSHNLLARLTDKRGRRFAETLCKEKARPKPGFWLVTPTRFELVLPACDGDLALGVRAF